MQPGMDLDPKCKMSGKPKVDGYNEEKCGFGLVHWCLVIHMTFPNLPALRRFAAEFSTDAVVQLDAVEPATFTTSGNVDGLLKLGAYTKFARSRLPVWSTQRVQLGFLLFPQGFSATSFFLTSARAHLCIAHVWSLVACRTGGCNIAYFCTLFQAPKVVSIQPEVLPKTSRGSVGLRCFIIFHRSMPLNQTELSVWLTSAEAADQPCGVWLASASVGQFELQKKVLRIPQAFMTFDSRLVHNTCMYMPCPSRVKRGTQRDTERQREGERKKGTW